MPVRSAAAVLETSAGSVDRDQETASLPTERRGVAKRYQAATLWSPRTADGRFLSVALTTAGGSPVLETVLETSAASLVTERRGVAKRFQAAILLSPRTADDHSLSVALMGGR